MINIAISAVLGIMISVFAVLFMDYWKNSAAASAVEQKVNV